MLLTLADQFRNLRRIILRDAQFDEALVLPDLETDSVYQDGPIIGGTSSALESINLPNLRRLIISGDPARPRWSFGRHYDSMIPQLDHLTLNYLYESDLEHLLLLSTSLQTLSCRHDSSAEGCSRVIDQIIRIDVKDLRF